MKIEIPSKRFYPESLKTLPIWSLWLLEKDAKGRLTKVSYSPTRSGRASSTDPASWGTFADAMDYARANAGLFKGLSVAVPDNADLVFADCDHCINEDGSLTETGETFARAFDGQFLEVSQSRTGLHGIARGQIARSFNNRSTGVEMYASKHFLALTGLAINRQEPTDAQEAIADLFDRYATKQKTISVVLPVTDAKSKRADSWIIEHATSNSWKFDSLFSGRWHSLYQSQSEADLALCNMLAFWCDRDPCQIDRIFRGSGLYRKKWDRNDYRNNTISQSIANCGETLSDYTARKNREKEVSHARELSRSWDLRI